MEFQNIATQKSSTRRMQAPGGSSSIQLGHEPIVNNNNSTKSSINNIWGNERELEASTPRKRTIAAPEAYAATKENIFGSEQTVNVVHKNDELTQSIGRLVKPAVAVAPTSNMFSAMSQEPVLSARSPSAKPVSTYVPSSGLFSNMSQEDNNKKSRATQAPGGRSSFTLG